ncbi:MAG: ABC transporter permease [Chitinophagaceae bacterium]
MVLYNLKIAWRKLWRTPLLSAINIGGLSIALACVLLIALFVRDEWSFDRFHAKGDRIVRLVQVQADTSGDERRIGNTGYPQGPAYAAGVPEIESYTRFKGWSMLTKLGGEGVEAEVRLVDPAFFDMFNIEVLKGNKVEFLRDRNFVVLSESTAKKYFKTVDCLGKSVELEMDEDFEPFTVSGVVKDMPLNTSIQFDMLVSFERELPLDPKARNEAMTDWGSYFLNTFFLLKPGADPKAVEKKLPAVFNANSPFTIQRFMKEDGLVLFEHRLQPFLKMHLDDQFYATNGLKNWSDAGYSYLLGGVALLILVIACINFVNIALALALRRSKESGIRKVAGGSRWTLFVQYMTEAFVPAILALLPAIIFIQLLLPSFNEITGRQFSLQYLFRPAVLSLVLGVVFLVAFLAGTYPALVASGFSPARTLYMRLKLNGKNWVGRSLVVFQFALAIILIIGTIVINLQFNYMTGDTQGYAKENIIRFDLPYNKKVEFSRLKQALLTSPTVQMVAGKGGDWNKTMFFINGKKTDWTYYEETDADYLKMMGVPVVKGRYLSYTNVDDTISGCLVNETFVKTYLDKTKDPIGQVVESNLSSGDGKRRVHEVRGVVKDYHLSNFKEKIEPAFFMLDKRNHVFNTLVKYHPGQGGKALSVITSSFRANFPYSIMNYQFMQDWNEAQYGEEKRWKVIANYSSVIAILLSCLGLFALSTLAVQQRVKEIGVRKVLGAGMVSIASLLSKDFLKLVFLSLLIAIPIAWYLANQWIRNYAYRIDMSVWIFLGASALVILLAILTVFYQSWNAARANPVKSLRSE